MEPHNWSDCAIMASMDMIGTDLEPHDWSDSNLITSMDMTGTGLEQNGGMLPLALGSTACMPYAFAQVHAGYYWQECKKKHHFVHN